MNSVLEAMHAGSDLTNHGKRWVLEHQNGAREVVPCIVIAAIESAGAIRVWGDRTFARAVLSGDYNPIADYAGRNWMPTPQLGDDK